MCVYTLCGWACVSSPPLHASHFYGRLFRGQIAAFMIYGVAISSISIWAVFQLQNDDDSVTLGVLFWRSTQVVFIFTFSHLKWGWPIDEKRIFKLDCPLLPTVLGLSGCQVLTCHSVHPLAHLFSPLPRLSKLVSADGQQVLFTSQHVHGAKSVGLSYRSQSLIFSPLWAQLKKERAKMAIYVLHRHLTRLPFSLSLLFAPSCSQVSYFNWWEV